MYKFYYPDGTKITGNDSTEKFLQFYSQVYYYKNWNWKLEKEILGILYSDELTEEGIMTILLWKIGEVNDGTGHKVIGTPYTKIDSKKICEELAGKKSEIMERVTFDKIRKFYNLDGKRFGVVYAITMMFFLTNGNWPIYDRFAHIALKVICDNLPFKDVVTDGQLEQEFHKGPNQESDCIKKEYCDKYVRRLKSVFDDKYITDRRIDQALWAYGHLFNDNKTNRKRKEG